MKYDPATGLCTEFIPELNVTWTKKCSPKELKEHIREAVSRRKDIYQRTKLVDAVEIKFRLKVTTDE